MKRLTWQELRAVCELAGYSNPKIRGDHLKMTRPGSARPVVIKMDKELGEDIVQSNKRTMGLTTDEFHELLDQVRGKKKGK